MAKRAKRASAAKPVPLPLSDFDEARGRWRSEVQAGLGGKANPRNRSGIEVKPLYTPRGLAGRRSEARLHGGAGLPRPAADDARHLPDHAPRPHLDAAPADRPRRAGGLQRAAEGHPGARRHRRVADPLQLGLPRLRRRRGAARDPRHLRRDRELGRGHGRSASTAFPIGDISTSLNDPSPFTLLALELAVAKRRGIPWERISGTSNQSDYLSHFVANHMFFRLALPGARRVLLDHIAFARRHLPQWNPLSVVGQHMQQAGATPAEAMGLTLSSAIQYASDCLARGWDPDQLLPRFTFFFDISMSFFEEVAKFRAGRRIWARADARALRRQGSALLALQVPRPDLGRGPDARAAAQQHRRA